MSPRAPRYRSRSVRLAIAGAAALVLVAAAPPEMPGQSRDSAEVVATIGRFHAALAAGDSTAALSLLAPDVAILESGGVESFAEYRSGHIRADIEYARAVPSQRTVTSVRVRGDAAWVTSTSVTQGEFRSRQVNSAGAELIVLSRENGAWKIRAVHWSSRQRRTAPESER